MSLPARVLWHVLWRWAQVRRARALARLVHAATPAARARGQAAWSRAVDAEEKYFRRLTAAPPPP
jgi:hypothetical protein